MTADEDAGELAVRIHGLAEVGRHWFPLMTNQLARVVLDLDAVADQLGLVSHQLGDPPALRDLVLLREELHVFVLKTMESMAATGDAVVAIAEDYLRTDEAVRDRYEVLLRSEPPFTDQVNNPGTTLPRPGDDPGAGRGVRPL